MRVIAASTNGAGHFTPMKPWLARLVAEGHEVLVVGPSGLAALAAGWEFRGGAEPDRDSVMPLWKRIFDCDPHEREDLILRELFTRTNSGALRPAMAAAFEEFRPDLLLRDPVEWASAAEAVARDVPQVRVGISLAEHDASFVRCAEPVVEEWLPGTADAVRAAPYLTRFPATLDPDVNPGTRRYRLAVPPPRRPQPQFVYATLGTEAPKFSHLRPWYPVLAEALGGLDTLLTVGRDVDPASVPAPDGVAIEPWADHGDVLARAEVVVHHGGSGTTLDALASGCPQVVLPLFADQPANGAALAATGLGAVVDRGEGYQMREPYDGAAGDIRAAVERVRTDEVLRQKAQDVAVEMAGLPELDLALLG